MLTKIILAGYGGQGIMFIGKLLASAVLCEGKFVSVIPSYGAEMRGGTANCTVIISDEPINSPYAEFADCVVAMSEQSYQKFIKHVRPKGLMVVNSTFLGRKLQIKGFKVVYKPFTDLANEENNIKIANMFALGCFVKLTQAVRPASIINSLNLFFQDENILNINRFAFNKGLKLAKRR